MRALLPSGAAWVGTAHAGSVGTGEIQVLPHPSYSPGPFAVAAGARVTVNFGSWSGNASWGCPWCMSRVCSAV